LAELENQVGQAPVIILGVGINLYQQQFNGLPNATSLARLGRPPADRALLLGTLVQAIERVQLNDTLDRWRARAHTLGRHVRVEGVEGIAESIREDGALIVGGIPVLAGDVELIAPVENGPG
jgi:biotin-(acetyl-CoA carboxylase) ligase